MPSCEYMLRVRHAERHGFITQVLGIALAAKLHADGTFSLAPPLTAQGRLAEFVVPLSSFLTLPSAFAECGSTTAAVFRVGA